MIIILKKRKKKKKCLSRAEVALAAAYNDIIDSILNYIKSTVIDNKAQFININVSQILVSMNYKKVLESIREADKMIIESRFDRSSRFEKYLDFSKSEHYKTLIDFALHINELQTRCEIESGTSPEERYQELLHKLKKCIKAS